MATATVEQEQLEEGIERIEREIERARLDIFEWELREKECNSLLQELRHSYIEAAGLRVQGKSAPVDTLAKRIEDLKEKSVGFNHVVATKRSQLADLQVRLQPLHAEQSRLAQVRVVAEERLETEKLVGATEQALADLNKAAEKFAAGLTGLRQRQYHDQGTKSFAFDSAQSLQRRGSGMRA